MALFKIKKAGFGSFGSHSIQLGYQLFLVIFIIIYVNLCNYMLSQVQGTIIFICIKNFICIYINLILFCIFSCSGGDRATFNKYAFILALYMFTSLLKLEFIQYILKYKCILFVFFYTILTVPQNTWIVHLPIKPECYSVYLVIFPVCTSSGMCFSTPGS